MGTCAQDGRIRAPLGIEQAEETRSQCKQYLLCMWRMWANLETPDTALVGKAQESLLLDLQGKNNQQDTAEVENYLQICNNPALAQDL